MCIVSATPLNEPSYAAVAKYDNTSAWRRPSTTDGTRKVSLNATSLSSPSLEVIGEHGNFYLVKVWSVWDHVIPLHLTTAIKFVEKYKAGKTDPVEKQNISRVVWPVPSRAGVTDDYWGWRSKPSNNKVCEFHYGADVGGGGSTRDIVAIMDGTLEYAANTNDARGYTVILKHSIAEKTFYTLYQHLSSSGFPTSTDVTNKKPFRAGEKIANMGATGGDYATHLHFELMRIKPALGTSTPFSYYSINPLGTYPDRDTRNTARPISPYNPEPFFKKNNSGNYAYNTKFDWLFDDPVPKNAQPVRFSHHSSYGIYNKNAGESQTINPGEG